MVGTPWEESKILRLPDLCVLTLMCSNSLSVSTLTDWLMILSREESARCAGSSLPCGSHCLQRCTKDLDPHTEISSKHFYQLLKMDSIENKLIFLFHQCASTWEEGSSWPELWFLKRIRPLDLQILPASHGTSPPSSGNWRHGDLWTSAEHLIQSPFNEKGLRNVYLDV